MSADKNRRVMFGLAGLGVFMLGMSFAAVPLYDMFCRVTGYGGTTQRAEQAPDVILDRKVTVRFVSNVDNDLPWRFKPTQPTMSVRIGETGLAFYEATNLSDQPIAGTASFNVTPFTTGGYFVKIACFCFTEQVLQPGESVQMPVTFYVDPDIMEDDEASAVNTITLSYTFHRTELPESAQAPVDGARPAG